MVLDALHLDHWRGEADQALQVYEVTGRLEIDPEASVVFEHGQNGDLELPHNLEHWNFFDRPEGSTFARTLSDRTAIRVFDDDHVDVTETYFTSKDDRLILNRTVTPVMLTMNEQAYRDDCLGYFMDKLG